MKITEKDVQYVADLANLELTGPERDRVQKDMNSILEYVDVLNRLNTDHVEPMAQVAAPVAPGTGFHYAMREDAPRPSLPRPEALRNAPDSDGVLFKVPKVIER